MYDRQQIVNVIESEINPILRLHQGACEVINYDPVGNVVRVSLKGGCIGCPSSAMTLFNGIVPILERNFPGIEIEIEP